MIYSQKFNNKDKYKKIVLVSGMIDDRKKKYLSKGMLYSSAEVLQSHIIEGVKKNNIKEIDIINSSFVGCYPFDCNKILIKGSDFVFKSYVCKDISFINLPLINEFSRARNILLKLKELSINEDVLVIFYSLLPRNLLAISKYKKINPNAKIGIIVTDMPKYMHLNETNSLIKEIYHRVYDTMSGMLLKKADKNVDYAVYLTEHMRELCFSTTSYCIIEGMIDEESLVVAKEQKAEDELIHIVYTGGLDSALGIDVVLEALNYIDNMNIVLDIAGAGPLEESVLSKAREDSRIVFHGLLDREQVLDLQKKARILVCPSRNNGKQSKYAFPAKIIEYLATGNFVIANRLAGIPEEYYQYVHVPCMDDAKGWAQCINTLLKEEVDYDRTMEQMAWIKNNKTSRKQIKKLLSLMKFLDCSEE